MGTAAADTDTKNKMKTHSNGNACEKKMATPTETKKRNTTAKGTTQQTPQQKTTIA